MGYTYKIGPRGWPHNKNVLVCNSLLSPYRDLVQPYNKYIPITRTQYLTFSYLCHIDLSVVHKIENILQLTLVNALQVKKRILMSVVCKDTPEEWRTCSLES